MIEITYTICCWLLVAGYRLGKTLAVVEIPYTINFS